MDRSFLYGLVVLLGITDALVYIQKTDPNLLSKFNPMSQSDGWQKDPGWSQKPEDKKEPKKDEAKPEEKKEESEPQQEKEQQEQGRKKHNFRLFRNN